ncbi:MAG: exonuclease SbcCD subunit D, partial [Actinomycetota bacterium]|nr:exonuclease SbcCD subunit D [Actinomycetota bacterium]
HLHRAQEIAPGIRYSGSPLAYSFPEADQVKSVTLVDLDAEGLSGVAVHALDRPRGLVTLTGTLDDLISDPRHEVHLADYVSAQLLDTTRPVDAMRRLRARFSYCVHLDWAPTGEHKCAGSYGERIAGRHDLEIVTDFVQHVRATPVTAAETGLLSAALAAGRVAERAS